MGTVHGQIYPPLPTHKLVNYETGECIIIPEIIYGMYDISNGILYKNPKYNPKYNPNGLVYDQETAVRIRYISPEWFDFMKSRMTIPFDKLEESDKRNKVFEQVCNYYGIKNDSTIVPPSFLDKFRKR